MADHLLEMWGNLPDGKLAEFIDDAPVMLHSIDAQGYLLQVNNFWAERLGYTPSDMIGKRAVDFMTERSRSYTLGETLPEFLRVGRASEILYQFLHRDGSIVHVSMSAIAKYNEDKSFSHSLAVISEVTKSDLQEWIPANEQLEAASDAPPVVRSPLERLQQISQELNVLVAEDNEMNRKVIEAFLLPTGVKATYVPDGQEALARLSDQSFDAALIDIDMPIMTGTVAVRRYREFEGSTYRKRLPIIACTALSGNDSINRFMDAGFDRYLPKPISIISFADCLEWIVKRMAQ